jgi:hypothetical protein
MSEKGPSAWQTERVVSLAMETLTKLREEDGLVLDTDEDLLAELHQEGVDIKTILQRFARSYLDGKANAEAAKLRIADLQARVERNMRAQASKRTAIQAIMEAIGIKKFPDPEFDLAIRVGEAKVIVPDENVLPDDLVEIKVIRTPDKRKIKARLDAGEDAGGAYLGNAPMILTIRSK